MAKDFSWWAGITAANCSAVNLNPARSRPFLSGISAEDVVFSKDGRWLAYVSYPEGNLWRSKPDGTQKIQLTSAPLFAALPRWSPDGKQIAFYNYSVGEPGRIYVVAAQGGAPHATVAGGS